MKLLIFDIDGTLTNTKEVDDASFVNAFQYEFGTALTHTNWAAFTNVTDTGLFHELYLHTFGSRPSQTQQARFQKRFFNNLEQRLAACPKLFQPAAGAPGFVQYCVQQPGYAVAFATGGWGWSARLKLQAAGILYKGLPFSCCDELVTRKAIVLNAVAQSQRHYGSGVFESMVYFGDGEWDYKTTAELQMPFIGVDIAGNQNLRRLGARHVLRNFNEINTVLEMINLCCT